MLLFNSASVMLNFSWIVLQMLLRCCLIHVIIIILRPILYLVYFYPYLGLGLFMSYLRDLVFIFSLIFIAINHVKSLKQTHLLLVHFLEYLLFQSTQTSLRRLQDVLKSSRRLTTKQDVVMTSGKRRQIYDVLKTSNFWRFENVWFKTSSGCLIYDVLKTSDLRPLEDV